MTNLSFSDCSNEVSNRLDSQESAFWREDTSCRRSSSLWHGESYPRGADTSPAHCARGSADDARHRGQWFSGTGLPQGHVQGGAGWFVHYAWWPFAGRRPADLVRGCEQPVFRSTLKVPEWTLNWLAKQRRKVATNWCLYIFFFSFIHSLFCYVINRTNGNLAWSFFNFFFFRVRENTGKKSQGCHRYPFTSVLYEIEAINIATVIESR